MNRHRLDAVSLVFGLLYVGSGLILMSRSVGFGDLNLFGLWPALLVLAGLAIFASSRRKEPPG